MNCTEDLYILQHRDRIAGNGINLYGKHPYICRQICTVLMLHEVATQRGLVVHRKGNYSGHLHQLYQGDFTLSKN
jgi:hypothetical protein